MGGTYHLPSIKRREKNHPLPFPVLLNIKYLVLKWNFYGQIGAAHVKSPFFSAIASVVTTFVIQP